MSELPIHPSSVSLITSTITSMPHALLVTGPKGVGLMDIAQRIAKRLQSPSLIITPKRKTDGGRTIVTDYEKGSMIIDDVRELYKTTRSKNTQRQVYLFDFGDRTMTTQAQNAFLKLLEEPRDNVYFVLVTSHPDALLPTVVSRARRLTVQKITPTQTNEFLDDLQVNDPVKRARIMFAATGLPQMIHQLAPDEALYDSRVKLMQDAKTMISGTVFEKFKVIQAYKDDRNGAVSLIDDINLQLESVLRRSEDLSVARTIDRHMETKQAIAANANIRLQLTADMIY